MGNFDKQEFQNEYVVVNRRQRHYLSKHPWILDNRCAKILVSFEESKLPRVEEYLSHSIGILSITGADDVYLLQGHFARRLGLPRKQLIPLIIGEEIRDWDIFSQTLCLLPYERITFEVIDISDNESIAAYITTYQWLLEQRIYSGSTRMVDLGYKWYELPRFSKDKLKTPYLITYPSVATHNHFVVANRDVSFKQSAPVVKLETADHLDYLEFAAILNCSVTAFQLKQYSYNKGAGEDSIRDRYDYAGSNVESVLLPTNFQSKERRDSRLKQLADRLHSFSKELPTLRVQKLFEQSGEAYYSWNSSLDSYVNPHARLPIPFQSATDLRAAFNLTIELREDIRQHIIFLQEEMDWLAYEMYGLIKKAPLARDYLTPGYYEKARLQLGQRAFELAGNGYTGDWPAGYQPDPLPEALKALTEARIVIIQSNKDIALLEDPLYKRRWVLPDYDQEFRDATRWWLAEKLEYALEQYGKPISLRRWARGLSRDARVMATLELLTGSPMFDIERELHQIILANAVPNRPEHYLKPSGLRQLGAQGAEFQSSDFSHSPTWKLRGKLNIPRERFIAYTEFDHTQRNADTPDSGGPWYGWAGWDAAQRADALAYLLDRANRAGWQLHWQQCGLRAALRQLLQQGKLDHLPPEEKLEFEGIAGMCGISLDTPCYCRAYREGIANGEPGVPGVTPEILAVKVLPTEKKKGRAGQRKDEVQADQLQLDI
jgi:hypothetical protein